MNNDSHLIWESFERKTLIKEQFDADVRYYEYLEEGLLGNIGQAVGGAWNKAKGAYDDVKTGFQQGAAGETPAPAQGEQKPGLLQRAGSAIAGGAKKLAGAAAEKIAVPLIQKAFTALQASAAKEPEGMAAKFLAAFDSGDQAGMQAAVDQGKDTGAEAEINNTPPEQQPGETVNEAYDRIFLEYLTENKLLPEYGGATGPLAAGGAGPAANMGQQPASATGTQPQQQSGGMISKVVGFIRKHPNLTTAAALTVIGLLSVSLGGMPALIAAAKGAGMGGLSGGAIGYGTGAIGAKLKGQNWKDAHQAGVDKAKTGARVGAVGGAAIAGGSEVVNQMNQPPPTSAPAPTDAVGTAPNPDDALAGIEQSIRNDPRYAGLPEDQLQGIIDQEVSMAKNVSSDSWYSDINNRPELNDDSLTKNLRESILNRPGWVNKNILNG